MGFTILIEELINVFAFDVLIAIVLSTTLGMIIGSLPGLSATMAIALLTGLTYNLPSDIAIPVLLGVYVGAIYGGSISAILLNIPGTGASAATALDGFPLAQKGEALKALYVTRIASFLGMLFGVIILINFTPLLSNIARSQFSSPEFFLLAMFGILICGSLASPDKPIKGWISGFIGIMVSMVGIEEVYAYQRFTFGIPELLGGISFIAAMIGIFGIPQIILTLSNKNTSFAMTTVKKTKEKWIVLKLTIRNWRNILRSGLVGVGIGTIPGAGEDIASWMAYDRAYNASKNKEEFGYGSYEGIIASETGNNSCIGGAMIPLLTLAVPGSPPAAVLLGALLLHGVQPGPMLSIESPRFPYEMTAILLVASFVLLIVGLFVSKVMVKALQVNPAILLPVIGALSVIGAYAINIQTIDIYVMIIFGFIGYILMKTGFPPAPLILGAILGPMADSNLRRALLSSEGDLSIFVNRPVALIFIILILITIFSKVKWFQKILPWNWKKKSLD
ncbi:tripartite tricarboxylate transporter permease [Virgibacillus sp. JSM 102003]|uniref:tripartite tricarboxylate transporter permease n=1 Tax=Virgibacillus sp. JSM 102003 TaxID=1562108 RepID=UPI0035C056AF